MDFNDSYFFKNKYHAPELELLFSSIKQNKKNLLQRVLLTN